MAEIVSFNPNLGVVTIAAAPDEDLSGYTFEAYSRSGSQASFVGSGTVDLSDPQISPTDPTIVYYTSTFGFPIGNQRDAVALVDADGNVVEIIGWGNDSSFTLTGGSADGLIVSPGNGTFAGDNDGNWYSRPPGGTWDGNNGSPGDGLPPDLEPYVPPCFTPGTLIDTPDGARPVEMLCVGDEVLTYDGQRRRVRWVGRTKVAVPSDPAASALRPVLIRSGAFGAGRPARDMRVSPRHRILIETALAELHTGFPQVLVAACHLVNGNTVIRDPAAGTVEYIHLLFDTHEILVSDGLPSESFHPGHVALAGVDPAQRAELLGLFPDLRLGSAGYSPLRYPELTRWEARLLAG